MNTFRRHPIIWFVILIEVMIIIFILWHMNIHLRELRMQEVEIHEIKASIPSEEPRYQKCTHTVVGHGTYKCIYH